jgi:hypothetical protein
MPFDTPRDEWGDGTIYSRPVSERDHRAGWSPPRTFYVAPRTPDDQALDRIVEWYLGTDWRSKPPPPLPASEPLPPLPSEVEE